MADQNDSDKKDYVVGYGKPPKASQFKKGESGNASGRPKGGLNLTTMLNNAMRETVEVVEKGRKKKITKAEAGAKNFVNSFAKGDPRARQQMLQIAVSQGWLPAPDGTTLEELDDDLVMRQLAEIVIGRATKKPAGIDDKGG